MGDTPIIVSTIAAPEGRGWVKLDTNTEPAQRRQAVRVAIYSDASLVALVQIQHLHPPLSGLRMDPGWVETIGFEWCPLRGGLPPFDNA